MKTNGNMRQDRRVFLQAAGAAAVTLACGALPFAARAANAADGKMKIGVVGSGRIGATLGEIWIKAGHEVMFSSLDLAHDQALAAKLGPNARAGTSREAAAFGDVILVAVPYSALKPVGKDLADLIKGKVVVDASNPIVARDGEIAFNAIGYARLPSFAQAKERTGMPIAGDDANALATASRLVRDVGLEPVVVGPLAMGKYLIPGTPLGGEHTPEQIKQIVATLK